MSIIAFRDVILDFGGDFTIVLGVTALLINAKAIVA